MRFCFWIWLWYELFSRAGGRQLWVVVLFLKSSDQCRVGFRLKPDLGIIVVVVVVKSWCDCAAISGLQFINLTFTTRFSIIISTIFTFDLLGQAISSRIPSRTRLPRLVLLHWSTISKQSHSKNRKRKGRGLEMPEHKRYDAAVVIKSHLKLLLFFFFFFWAEVSSRLCCRRRPTSKASYSFVLAMRRP